MPVIRRARSHLPQRSRRVKLIWFVFAVLATLILTALTIRYNLARVEARPSANVFNLFTNRLSNLPPSSR